MVTKSVGRKVSRRIHRSPATDTKHGVTAGPFPTLSRCQGLRELEVGTLPPTVRVELSLIASITSTNLQKITFPGRYGFVNKDNSVSVRYYETIDDTLCRLVERLRRSGYKHRLDMAFSTWDVLDGGETSFKELLPRFREQGRVKVVCEPGWRVAYCSD